MTKKNCIDNKTPRWRTKKYFDITVYYITSLNGGGTTYGQDFIPLVKKIFGKVDRLCEFCSGAGFIGFSLLANKLCNSLCLIDINPEAIKACSKTIEKNGISNKANAYVSNVFENIPVKEKWDLVVCNPPHFNREYKDYKKDIIGVDPNWEIHRKFYKTVKKNLSKNGSILFVENLSGSSPQIWKTIISDAGLQYVKTIYYNPTFIQKVFRSLREVFYECEFNPIKYVLLITKNDLSKKTKAWIFSKPYQFYFVLSKVKH